MLRNILFVCTGNTCRSPMAAAAFKHMCAQQGFNDTECDSAGIRSMDGDPVSDAARAVLAERNIPLLRLRSQRLTRKQINRADLIVTMTEQHRDVVRERFRQARMKTVPLMAYGNDNRRQVPDPFGGTVDTYRDCLDLMMPALEGMLEELK